ncbi:4-hydroxyphenylpyruvate dioxygenase [Kitasatospora aureofaciens]|uniref:4-hydroxyphenylpyruvate dioxygenase n=1 Tax=Kitasatospora aureofaciens TaxID=1894 RepID=UPI0033F101C1
MAVEFPKAAAEWKGLLMNPDVFGEMSIDYVEFYVRDTASAAAIFAENYGFTVSGVADAAGENAHAVSLESANIRLVLTSARWTNHPAGAYVERHGDGVANIALAVGDATRAWKEAVRRGASPVTEPAESNGVITAAIAGFGDVLHTFVQRTASAGPSTLPGCKAPRTPRPGGGSGLLAVDHFAVCLEAGTLNPTVEFYERVLDFRLIFEERIAVGSQAMASKVVQSKSGKVTLTLIEPDTAGEPGQIDKFLRNHGGPGVQHVAFITDDIVRSVEKLESNGVGFLATPGTYYDLLAERIQLSRHQVPALRKLNILVDEDHDGQLFQIFTKPMNSRGTIFMEIIERMGARTFGSGNIKALYEAVELDQTIEVKE